MKGRYAMVTPPGFGGRETEEELIENLGAPREEHAVHPRDEEGPEYDDNEEYAVGQECEKCGMVIAVGQEVRRRLDGRWVHETCPIPGT